MAMPGIFAKFPKAPRAMNFEMRSSTAPTHALSRLVNEFFFSLSFFFNYSTAHATLARPRRNYAAGNLATGSGAWFNRGTRTGVRLGVLARFEGISALDVGRNSVSLATINFASRTHFRPTTNQTFLSELVKLCQLCAFPSLR